MSRGEGKYYFIVILKKHIATRLITIILTVNTDSIVVIDVVSAWFTGTRVRPISINTSYSVLFAHLLSKLAFINILISIQYIDKLKN